MNYTHLQYFATVVQHGSIKAAAEQLSLSQPTVSAAIRKLEDEFEVPLLDRRRDGSVPTSYGRLLYESATTMSGVLQTVRDRIAAARDPSRGRLRVGTGPSVATEYVVAALTRLVAEYAQINITHVKGDRYETLEQLLTVDEIDIALCHVPERNLPSSLNHQLVSDNPIGAFVAAHHLPPDTKRLASSVALETFSWITPRDDEVRRPASTRRPRAGKVERPPNTSFSEDLQLIKQLTLVTRSIGFMPTHMVKTELQSGEFVELISDHSTVERPIYALTRKAGGTSQLIDLFQRAVSEVFAAADSSTPRHRRVRLVSD